MRIGNRGRGIERGIVADREYDRLYTDVATGVNNGAKGVLVLTGETHLEDVETSDTKPDAIYESIAQMGQLMLS